VEQRTHYLTTFCKGGIGMSDHSRMMERKYFHKLGKDAQDSIREVHDKNNIVLRIGCPRCHQWKLEDEICVYCSNEEEAK
ncbi:uncharacterized protein METZ01_LOCUS210171, partial [marine metagenome]